MKVIGWAAGLVVLAAFVVAPLLYGYRAPAVDETVASGRAFIADTSTSTQGAVGVLTDTPLAGNALYALLFFLVGLVVTVWLVSGARTGRGITLTSLFWGGLALALYLPGSTF